MSEPEERIAATCPSCSPDVETIHQVLHAGGQATVRCNECGHVHKTTPPDDSEIERQAVVSQSGDSRRIEFGVVGLVTNDSPEFG